MSDNQMNKPISMLIEETSQSLFRICNESNLHPSILELIVKDLYNELVQVKNIQTKKEKEIFDSHLSELEENVPETEKEN